MPRGIFSSTLAYIPGLEQLAGVGKLETDFGGAGLWIERRVDKHDAPLQGGLRVVRERHRRRLSDLHEGQFILVDVGGDPDLGEIGDGVQLIAGFDIHPGQGHFLDDGAGQWGMDRQRATDLPGTLQILDVVLGDVPEFEAPVCHLQQRFRPLGDLWKGALTERALALERQQILRLGSHQLGAVEREEDLSLLHVLRWSSQRARRSTPPA